MKNTVLVVLVALIALIAGLLLAKEDKTKLGGSPPGIPADFSTSSALAVGEKNPVMYFATSTRSCSSRVISTGAQAISIWFTEVASSTIRLAEGSGHLQAASTTVNYDAAVYGCGAWLGTGFGASTTIYRTEFK